MCTGIQYQYHGRKIKYYFSNAKAQLPVKKRDGSTDLLAWGRRKGQLGRLPLGAVAPLTAIKQGRWNKFSPRPILIPIDAFLQNNSLGNRHWVYLQGGEYIQGLVATLGNEQRVYIVTMQPTFSGSAEERWPKIIAAIPKAI
jgi:hypothetical protein